MTVRPPAPRVRYFDMREIAKLVGKTTPATRNWLVRNGAAVKRGGRVVTTPALLREAFPEIYDEIRGAVDDDDY